MSPPTAFLILLSVQQYNGCCWKDVSGISDSFLWSYMEDRESLKTRNETRAMYGKYMSHFHALLFLLGFEGKEAEV